MLFDFIKMEHLKNVNQNFADSDQIHIPSAIPSSHHNFVSISNWHNNLTAMFQQNGIRILTTPLQLIIVYNYTLLYAIEIHK